MKRLFFIIVLFAIACITGAYLFFGKSTLERDAEAVGKLVAAIPFCEFNPRRGALDVYFGKYDFERPQSEQFEALFTNARDQERAQITAIANDQKASYCADMREFAQAIPFGLHD